MRFIYYLYIIYQFITFFYMGIDKQKAKLNQWRISEKTLFFLAFIGWQYWRNNWNV